MVPKIVHHDAFCRTPAVRLAARGWLELLDANLIDDSGIPFGWDYKSIVAYSEDDTPIGVLVWADQAWGNQISISLAYVLPDYRRMGVHTAMWLAIVDKARELKRPVISSSASIRNAASRASMASQGRGETGVSTVYHVPLLEGNP